MKQRLHLMEIAVAAGLAGYVIGSVTFHGDPMPTLALAILAAAFAAGVKAYVVTHKVDGQYKTTIDQAAAGRDGHGLFIRIVWARPRGGVLIRFDDSQSFDRARNGLLEALGATSLGDTVGKTVIVCYGYGKSSSIGDPVQNKRYAF